MGSILVEGEAIDSDRKYNFYVTTYCVSQEHTGILCNCEVRLYINFVSVDKLNSGYSHIPIELAQVILGALLERFLVLFG